jgi:RND family efflux transporter MFP subunit
VLDRRIAYVVAVGVVVTSLISACSVPTTNDPRLDPPLVRTVVVESNHVSRKRSFTGIVAARVQSDQSFRVSGKVLERFVSAGQQVRRGQPLMRLDASDLRLALDAREAEVVASSASARQATEDEIRDKKLAGDGAIPASTYDRVKASAEAARSHLKAVQAHATIARNALAYTLLVAEADGVIVETLAEPGQVVGAGQTVVRLAQHGPRDAVVHLPETLRPPLGSTVQAAVYGHAGASITAQLRELSSAADPVTRTFQAKYVLEGSIADAPLGATITVVVSDDGTSHDLRAPISAVFDPGSGPGVWTVIDQPTRVKWRPIKIDRIDDETVSVRDGLKAGERIVSLGAHVLHEGQEVRLIAAATRQGPPP